MEGKGPPFLLYDVIYQKICTFDAKYSQLNSNLYEKLILNLNLYDYDF